METWYEKKVFKIHIFLGDRRESWVGMSTLLLRKSRFTSQHPHRRDHTTHSSSSGGPDHSLGLWVHLHSCAHARTYACTHTHTYNKNKSLKTLVYVGWSLTVHVCHPRTREKLCRGRRTSLGHTVKLCENFLKFPYTGHGWFTFLNSLCAVYNFLSFTFNSCFPAFRVFYFYLYILWVCVFFLHVCLCATWRPEQGIGSPRIRVIDNCQTQVAAENRTLWKSKQCS